MLHLEIAFKLVNEIDVETTKQAIDKFVAENRDLIRINTDRLVCFPRMSDMCIIFHHLEPGRRALICFIIISELQLVVAERVKDGDAQAGDVTERETAAT